MKTIRIYEFSGCGTCKEALKFLANNRYAVDRVDIFTNPPTKAELTKMLEYVGGNIKKICNTTGKVYQDMGLKDKLPTMTTEQAIDMLSKNGRLIKRPFVLLEDKGLVGFKKDAWKKVFA